MAEQQDHPDEEPRPEVSHGGRKNAGDSPSVPAEGAGAGGQAPTPAPGEAVDGLNAEDDESVAPGPSNPDQDLLPGTEQAEILNRGAMMAVGTIISRLTGLLRDVSMTAALGLGIVADIFTVGNTIPNTVYVMTVGGAMNAIFVPQLVRRIRSDSDGGAGYADRLITLTIVVLVLLTLGSLAIAPWLTSIYASPQYTEEQFSLAVTFARYCLPQVFFYGLFTLLSQVLNARGRFSPPMYAPIANNIVSIAVFMSFLAIAGPTATSGGTLTPEQTAWLGIGSTIAVATQALMLIPFLRSSGYRFRARFDWRGWGLSRAGGLALWTLGLLAANQVSFIVHSRLATTANVMAQEEGLPEAGITTYQKAYLIFFLPHSIVTVSLVTALLPGLAAIAHAGKLQEMGTTLAKTIRTVIALVVPITAVLIPLAPLLAGLLFGYGAAGADAAMQIGITVMGMLIGLVPFTIYFILLRGWYSLEDTRTPFFLSLALNAINVVLSIGLFFLVPTQFKVPAIGLALGLTYWVMMVVAWPVLGRRIPTLDGRRTWAAIGVMLIAGLLVSLSAVAVYAGMSVALDGVWDSRWEQLLTLGLGGVVGLVTYLIVARVLRIQEVSEVLGLIRGKVGL